MTGILAARVVIKTTPGWELWLEGHIGLILAVLTIVILWRIGGSILWHLGVALAIGFLAEKASNIVQLNSITTAVAKGKPVGPTGSTPLILGAVVVLLLVSAIFAFRSPRSAMHRSARKEMAKMKAAAKAGGGGEEE